LLVPESHVPPVSSLVFGGFDRDLLAVDRYGNLPLGDRLGRRRSLFGTRWPGRRLLVGVGRRLPVALVAFCRVK